MFWLLPILALLAMPQQTPRLSADWVKETERQVDIVAILVARGGHERTPLDRYARFYALAERDGRPIVRAIYIPGLEPCPKSGMLNGYPCRTPADIARHWAAGIHIKSTIPTVSDAGCGGLIFRFDYATRRLIDTECSPEGVGPPQR